MCEDGGSRGVIKISATTYRINFTTFDPKTVLEKSPLTLQCCAAAAMQEIFNKYRNMLVIS